MKEIKKGMRRAERDQEINENLFCNRFLRRGG